MKTYFRVLLSVLAISASQVFADTPSNTPPSSDITCQGKFINPITDICWSCMFPISLGGDGGLEFEGEKGQGSNEIPGTLDWLGRPDELATLLQMSGESRDSLQANQNSFGAEDNGSTPDQLFCACSSPDRLGVVMSFWEPVHLVEVVNQPFCFPSLGGVNLGADLDQGSGNDSSLAKYFGGTGMTTATEQNGFNFRHVHWYLNPTVFWLEAVMDTDCLEKGGLDIGWMSEVDPTWKHPGLAMLQAPESALFANVLAQAACSVDCLKSTFWGFGFKPMFWCAGCQGSIYPYSGFSVAAGEMNLGRLMVQRMQAKMHRDLVAWRSWGDDTMCGYKFQPVMDKTGYKMAMTYPVPARKYNGRCCEPFGRSAMGVDANKNQPFFGGNVAYQLFRKRDCCGAYDYE